MSYKEKAREARRAVLKMIHQGGTSHVGSVFSCIDILTVLFEGVLKKEDEFILSKGWAVSGLYHFLVKKKILPKEAITTFCKKGSPYIGLAEPMPGVVFAGGSVGMGLSAAFGRALAKRRLGEDGRVYVLESDGGLDVGHVWEAMLLCAHHNLPVTLVIDDNGFQAMGSKEEILSIKDMDKTFRSRGWKVLTIDGHDYEAIEEALSDRADGPLCIFAKTKKGKGVKQFEEEGNKWHYWRVDKETYRRSLKELC